MLLGDFARAAALRAHQPALLRKLLQFQRLALQRMLSRGNYYQWIAQKRYPFQR